LKVGATSDPKKADSTENIKRGIGMLEKLAAEEPNNARARRDVGYAYYQLGNTLVQAGDYPGALASRRKAFAIREQVAAQDPKNVQARFDLAVAHGDLAEALSATGESASALDHARQSLSAMQELAKSDPTNAVYRRNVGLCYEKLGEAYVAFANNEKRSVGQRISDWNEARSWYRKGAELFSTLRDRGTLMPADSEQPKKFAAKVQECDTAVAQLKR
jgi:tetratricopeptide (TPR) repeat protein